MPALAILYHGLSICGLLALAGGYLGRLHPLGDSLAVFRTHLAAAGVLWLGGGAVLGVGPVWAVALPMAALLGQGVERFRTERAGPLTLYQKNMSYRMPDIAPLAADWDMASSPAARVTFSWRAVARNTSS